MEEEIGTWDSVLLENLSEDSFINNIHQRYKQDHIYTYIGTSVVALNPYHTYILDNSLDKVRNYGSKGIFQMPPHIYGLTNLAFQSLKDQSEDQCIFLMGESGAGKTESFKMIVNFLTHIQNTTSSTPHTFRKQSSAGSTCGLSHKDNRSSSICLESSTCNLLKVNSSTNICRRQTASPNLNHRARLRSESSERHVKSNTRDKFVNFKISHHKSSENIPCALETTMPQNVYPIKLCSKHKPVGKKQYTASLNTIASGKVGSSPKYVHIMGENCRQCGHSKCSRSQSIEQDEHRNLAKGTKRFAVITHMHKQLEHGSCSNLLRQFSIDSQVDYHALTGSMQRIPSYGDHKILVSKAQSLATSAPAECSQHCKSPSRKVREWVTCADVFLEAMGNATTIKNNNSSRYGKLFDIEIDFKGEPKGVHITHYMLEKTRITETAVGERNFHIFYQLLLGADLQLLKTLKLYRNVEKYGLLKNTTGTEEDRTNFYYTKKSLNVIGLNCDEIYAIFRIIAVVLKLGNFIFVPVTNIDGTEGCQISNVYEVQETAQLINLDSQILINCLTRATSSSNIQEDVGCEMDARQAAGLRNILCRTLYSRLFTWLVNKINNMLKSTQREKNLALLDFYGFEVLESNSFEQFAINYSAEKIHQNFVQNILKGEQELYLREGLEWMRIDYFDNESICGLIDKPSYGILSLINEPHLNTNEGLFLRIQQCCAGHTNFMLSNSNSLCFQIRHFANVVNYSVHRFLEKNSDNLPKYVSTSLYQSKLPLVQNLFPEGNPRRQPTKKPNTLSSNIRTQLQTLLGNIKHRRAHYIFCIKPNECKKPYSFDLALVQHQVRYMSLLPLIHLYRTGHCFHLSHSKFFHRYKLLSCITWPHYHAGSTVEGIALIIRNLPLPPAEFTIGIKNVFIRSPRTVFELEQYRKLRMNDLAILIQKTFRMYFARKTYQRMRHSQMIISSVWRTWRAREKYRYIKYKLQVKWAVAVIIKHYRNWKIRQYLLTIPRRLPPNTLSPLSMEFPIAPVFLIDTARILRAIYYRWKCYVFRSSFDQTARNRMREKVTASIIFKDRKASYAKSVGYPFIGDYVRLRHNQQWKKICSETNDQYVVFADIINKITRSSGKFTSVLLVLSTSALLLLDQRTLQIKYRVPASEIYRMSLSPYVDDIAVFHVKTPEFGRKKGDFVLQTGHVIEIITKMFLVIQNATGKPPEIRISTEFEANFGQQTVTFSFKYSGLTDLAQGPPKVTRKANRMEIIV